jgi:predicted amidohydrolase
MKVTLAQLSPASLDVAANVETACEVIAANRGSDLVVFPEAFLSGYPASRSWPEVALDPEGPELRRLAEAAASAGSAVVAGALMHGEDDDVVNVAVCIGGDGSPPRLRHKTHMWGTEAELLTRGESLGPIDLCGLPMGIMICFDLEFPEVARTLALRGAQLLVTVSANMDPFGGDHYLYARTRALENALPHVYVNRVGEEAGNLFVGGSIAANDQGAILVGAGSEPAIFSVDVPLESGRDKRLDYLPQRQPHLYESGAPTPARGL